MQKEIGSFVLSDYYSHMDSCGMYICDSLSEDLLSFISDIGRVHDHGDGKYIWDIRFDDGADSDTLARSRTMKSFVLHTDCAYEVATPDRICLHVLQHDALGGGVSRFVSFDDVMLSDDVRDILKSDFSFRVPDEYLKDAAVCEQPILFGECDNCFRYRREIIDESLCSDEQLMALDELDAAISKTSSFDVLLEKGQTIFIDNTRVLHARTEVKDRCRHLQRIRYYSV